MNKKGQSLIIFVLLLPLIVFFLALFVDMSMIYLENNKVKGIIKDNLKICIDNGLKAEEKIKKIIKENDKNINIDIKINNDDISLSFEKENKSIFGKLFKFEFYDLKGKFCGNYTNKKIKEC